ncbi:hypothetical protein [Ktedonobacter robiniae]|uniref:Uncharacterized protein n=1 Tax=Ktedonobacter robiniae TaxID=2778365 RepID=A0ABQ3UX40_9CHLR|nr:hypothetical protein [Ktedonobacter robiniae]GHO57271.1 hypothetical protein KSB_57460 [Ktedonobacter robiniae]
MQTFTDSILNTLDRISKKSSLLDRLTERLLPTTTAQACGGYLCYDTCANLRCGHYDTAYRQFWATTISNCNAGNYSCTSSVCGGC